MTKEALKLALEALETPWNAPYVDGCDLALGKKVKAITAIKEFLAQPKQEPVAWAKFSAKGNIIDLLNEPDDGYTPLYATPPHRTWVGLTDDDILLISADCAASHQHMDIQFARAIEAKLRSKNNE